MMAQGTTGHLNVTQKTQLRQDLFPASPVLLLVPSGKSPNTFPSFKTQVLSQCPTVTHSPFNWKGINIGKNFPQNRSTENIFLCHVMDGPRCCNPYYCRIKIANMIGTKEHTAFCRKILPSHHFILINRK